MTETDRPRVVDFAPVPDISYSCPLCDGTLESEAWHMPGMRPLALLPCTDCGREFFGDLPSGNALHTPTLLDCETGETYQPHGESYWFAKWLRESYRDRTDSPVEVTVEGIDSVEQPAVLNCLDALYGHALLKVFNVQQFVEGTDRDVVVLVQPNFRWLVPEDAAAVVTVDLSLGRGYEWNESLAAEFRDIFSAYDDVALCGTDPHPHPSTFDIERYTSVEPHALDGEWGDSPTVTFVWRDDRCWSRLPPWAIVEDFFDERAPIDVKASDAIGAVGGRVDDMSQRLQKRKVLALEMGLRERFSDLDFAVAGVAEPGGFPDRITDLRIPAPSDEDERRLCERYAASSVVVGVHGSNMLLPSAHAGATVELLSTRRWGNMLQDLVVRQTDAYEALFHTRLLPLATTPEDLATCVGSLLGDRDGFRATLPQDRYSQ